MNKVYIELNSYKQSVKIKVNDKELANYSELKNFTYKKITDSPSDFLDAMARDLNDDFVLEVTATTYTYQVILNASKNNQYCISCNSISPLVSYSTKERYEKLADVLNPSVLLVSVTNAKTVPEDREYGPLKVKFTVNDDNADCQINFVPEGGPVISGRGYVNIPGDEITTENIIHITETYFLNPMIGKTIKGIGEVSKEIQICECLTPIITFDIEDKISAGKEYSISLNVFPEKCETPKIVFKSSNPSILTVEGHTVTGIATGDAVVSAYFAGEKEPFEAKGVSVYKTINVTKIEILGVNDSIPEGTTIELAANLYPEDADDKDTLVFESSNPEIAEIKGNTLILKNAGEFTLTAKTAMALNEKSCTVTASLKSLKLSLSNASVNVGSKTQIEVEVSPVDAYNAEYTWETSDKTVAVVVNEEGKEYIKAVGIGECVLTCVSVDGKLKEECKVFVNSVLYEKKKKSPVGKIVLAIIAVFCIFTFMRTTFASAPDDIKTNEPINYSKKYPDAASVDVFENIDVLFSGSNGEGVAIISNNSTDEFVRNCSFIVNPSSGLANGDEVTISVKIDEAVIDLFNSIPSKAEKTYVVSGLSEQISGKSQIPESFIKEATAFYLSEVDTWNRDGFGFTYSPAKAEGAYFLSDQTNNETLVCILASYEEYKDGELYRTKYCAAYYINMEIDSAGNAITPLANYEEFTYDSLDEALSDIYADDDTYITVQIQ